MKTMIIGAGSDLGIHIDGAKYGPDSLLKDIKSTYSGETVNIMQDADIIKSRNLSDKRKNEYEIDKFNTKVYEACKSAIKKGLFPITIGGDATVAIASTLANADSNVEDIGLIWIGAHALFDTFETTTTGNIHDLSCATLAGYKCEELRGYSTEKKIIYPAKCIILGVREIESSERENIKYSGVTVIKGNELKEKGIKEVIENSFKQATEKTKSVHVVFSLDLLDPSIAPGVSLPEEGGIEEKDTYILLDEILKHYNDISAFDIVELNPLRDINRKTEQIALNILATTIMKIEKYKNVNKIRKY